MHMYIVDIHVCDVWLPICLNSNKPIPWFDCYTQYTQLSPSDVLWPRGGSWSRGPASDPCRSGVGSLFAKTNVRPTVAGWNWFFLVFFRCGCSWVSERVIFHTTTSSSRKNIRTQLEFRSFDPAVFFFAEFIFFGRFHRVHLQKHNFTTLLLPWNRV
jgi:hypothetical protein